jgi:hypothetical protein
LCLQERPDLANLKSALVVSNAKMKAELAALEGRILGLLSASSGNILDDEELINTLAQAKVRGCHHSAITHCNTQCLLPVGACNTPVCLPSNRRWCLRMLRRTRRDNSSCTLLCRCLMHACLHGLLRAGDLQ